jgi:tRNA(fMet)-specific endonuclease VapC
MSELVFDGPAGREAGRIRARLESQGRMIGTYDVLLAGQARSAGLTLVTANVGDFRRVPKPRKAGVCILREGASPP